MQPSVCGPRSRVPGSSSISRPLFPLCARVSVGLLPRSRDAGASDSGAQVPPPPLGQPLPCAAWAGCRLDYGVWCSARLPSSPHVAFSSHRTSDRHPTQKHPGRETLGALRRRRGGRLERLPPARPGARSWISRSASSCRSGPLGRATCAACGWRRPRHGRISASLSWEVPRLHGRPGSGFDPLAACVHRSGPPTAR